MLWAVGIAVIVVSRWQPAGLLSVGWGVLYYLFLAARYRFRPKDWGFGGIRVVVHATALIAISFLSIVMAFLVTGMTWNPIGVGDDFAPGPCRATNRLSSSPDQRLVATTRLTWCFGARDAIAGYFIFVHLANEPASGATMIFRYTPTLAGSAVWPRVIWKGNTRLSITVPDEEVYQVTARRTSRYKVHIAYRIGDAILPKALFWWQRPLGPKL